MKTPRVIEVRKVACPEGKEDYIPSRVLYDDGKVGFDCDGSCPQCEYESERQVWKARGYLSKFGM